MTVVRWVMSRIAVNFWTKEERRQKRQERIKKRGERRKTNEE